MIEEFPPNADYAIMLLSEYKSNNPEKGDIIDSVIVYMEQVRNLNKFVKVAEIAYDIYHKTDFINLPNCKKIHDYFILYFGYMSIQIRSKMDIDIVDLLPPLMNKN